MVIYRPDGQKFLTSVELEQRVQQESQRAARAELLLEQERQRSVAELQRADMMAEYLRSIGVDPDNLP